MRLRDSLKSLRGDRDATPAGPEEPAAASDVPDPMRFGPRQDGYYRGSDDAGYLRFRGFKVYRAEATTPFEQLSVQLAPGGKDPEVGDYTSAGRFTVQRRFERPMIHTVLETREDSFVARVTQAGSGTKEAVVFEFVSDQEAAPA